MLGKSITNITEHEDGTISFRFLVDGQEDDIHTPRTTTTKGGAIYTLQGVRVAVPTKGNIYIHQGHLMIWR